MNAGAGSGAETTGSDPEHLGLWRSPDADLPVRTQVATSIYGFLLRRELQKEPDCTDERSDEIEAISRRRFRWRFFSPPRPAKQPSGQR